jgi:hypothetical protein
LAKFVFEATGAAPKELHAFVCEVLAAAKVPNDNYAEHPSRLDKLFSMELQDDLLAHRVREDFESTPPSKVRK